MKRLTLLFLLLVLTGMGYAQRQAVKMHTYKPVQWAKDADTLIPASFTDGEPALYLDQNGGFVSGVNSYSDRAKAQAFETTGITMEGCGVWIGAKEKVGDWDNIALKVYALDGEGTNASGSVNTAPGTVLASKTLSVADLDTTGGLTDVMFDSPVEIDQAFAVGLDFAGIDDTLGIITTSDGDATTDLAWEQFSDGSWYSFQAEDSWGLAVDLGFFPYLGEELETYNVTFSVDDGANPIKGASVTVNGTTQTTGSSGNATFSLTDGNYQYLISKAGYNKASGTVTVSGSDVSKSVSLTATTGADTLMPASFQTGTPTVYGSQNGGFISGVNGYGDRAKAQAFDQSGVTMQECLVWIAAKEKVGNWDNIALKVYALDGNGMNASGETNKAPGTVLASKSLSVADLDTVNVFTSIKFDNPVEINEPFAVGLDFAGIDDTLGIVTTTDGEATADNAWEQWSNESWYSFQAADSWGLAVDLGFFPVVGPAATQYDVNFTVTDGSQAIEGATIKVGTHEITTNANGEAAVKLPNGSYYYMVSAENYENASGTLDVSGSDVNLEVTLNEGSGNSYEVTFAVTADGNPLEDATIKVDGNTLTTNAQGEATVSLQDGEYLYTVNAEGFIELTAIVNVDGSATEEAVTLTPATGIAAARASGIRIYPNPADVQVTIEGPAIAHIRLLNMHGELLRELTPHDTKTRLNVQSLKPGIYLLQLRTRNTQIYTKKLLIR